MGPATFNVVLDLRSGRTLRRIRWESHVLLGRLPVATELEQRSLWRA